MELLLIIANIGTAVVIVPIMRRQFEELSIGYVTARIVECTFILVGIVAMLGIATLQQETAGAAEGTVAYTLAAIKDWTFLLGPGWVVGWGNGLILGYMMYRTRARAAAGGVARPGRRAADHHLRDGRDVRRRPSEQHAALVPGPRNDPRGRVGALPRRLLHHLGFQARCPDPFRERRLTTQAESPLAPDAAIDKRRVVMAALVLAGHANEAPEVLGVKGDLDALACLLFQSREHLLARLPEDLDPDRCVERLVIRCSCSLGNNRDVRFHRGGIRVNLDDETSSPASFTYSLNAIKLGSLASTNSTRPGTRTRSLSSRPGLRRFVAMKINGPCIPTPCHGLRPATIRVTRWRDDCCVLVAPVF